MPFGSIYSSDSYAMVLSKYTRLWLALVKDQWNYVADSVPEFPYACAIQYRQVRGRALLPGSEWDRV